MSASHVAGQQVRPPVLVSEPNSTRAIALDSPTLRSQPFSPTSINNWNSDGRNRVMLFVLGLTLQPGEGVSSLRAEAEDAQGRRYDLVVEDFRKTIERDWLSQIVLRLSDNLGDVGDCLVKISYRGVPSNRVRVAIGHTGGGPPDDVGALPTPAPPYTLSGRVTVDGAAAAGINVALAGAESGNTVTNSQGVYSFTVNSVGDYSLTPNGIFVFSPAARTFNNLSGNRTADFATATAMISGRVKDDLGNAVPDVTVVLSGPLSASTSSAADGSFSFPHLPAGQSYTIRPTETSLFAYTAQSVSPLSGDAFLNFNGVRRTYTLVGTVRNNMGAGLSGISVTLSGAVSRVTTTDLTGRYSFTDVLAGNFYYLTPDNPDLLFNPESQPLFLTENQVNDFVGVSAFRLTGRIADANNQPIFGVKLFLTGSGISTTTTAADGSYLLKVRPGTYTVTPSFDQGFYSFFPLSRTFSLPPNRTADFQGTFTPLTGPISVLEFDGSQMSVNHGLFWPAHVNLGSFFWEMWAMPGPDNYTRYLLSDGYGGAHALLFGFGFTEPGRYNLSGNIWKGDGNAITFNSAEGPAPNEWGHYAVGWDGSNVITYYDGVPVGKVPFSGPRQTLGEDSGAGHLFMGGSNHQNLRGRIAQVRGFEDQNPRTSSPESTFTPQTLFSTEGNFVSYYLRPSSSVADLTRTGYLGVPHHGVLGFPCGGGCPIPQFVQDPTAPSFLDANPPQISSPAGTPASPPAGARVFDSFTRSNSTYILGGNGGLGSTESGSEGPLTWQTSSQETRKPFGILAGRAVLLADTRALAWVVTSSPNQQILVSRGLTVWGSGLNTGIAFRVSDRDNHFFAYTDTSPTGSQRLNVGYFQSGTRVDLTNSPTMPGSWSTLEVITDTSGRIEVYVDGTQIYSANSPLMATATGAGLYNFAGGMALTNRWDNFTIVAPNH